MSGYEKVMEEKMNQEDLSQLEIAVGESVNNNN